MFIKIIWFCLLATLSGILYRMGGAKKYDTKFRDLGCPTIFIFTLLLFGKTDCSVKFLLSYFLTFGLTLGALTTYGDTIFGYDNFYFHGFIVGLATIPCMFLGIHLYAICIRATILALIMGLWCNWIKEDVLAEFGRGVFIVLTLPLLLL